MAKHAAEERKSWAIGLVASFLLSSAFVGGVVPGEVLPASAVSATDVGTCNPNGVSGTGNTYTVTIRPSHGKAFYIDTGQGQDINAGYIGYRVTASGTVPDVNVRLTDFTGGVIKLANPAEGTNYLGSLTSSVKAAYFFLSAPTPTTTPQGHRVTVYSGNTPIITCTYSFERVRETIKAAANKLDGSPAITATSTNVIGGNLVVTHKGLTGTIGAGSTPDFDTIWLSPASNIAWPSTALKLVDVSVLYTSKTNATMTVNNDLILRNARTSIELPNRSLAPPAKYTATYTFKILGRATGAIRPVAQISSGTQMKHTDMAGVTQANANIDLSSAELNVRVTKSSSPAVVSTSGKIEIPFRVSLVNSGGSEVVLDTIEDVASISGNLVLSSIRFNSAAYSLGSSSSSPVAQTNTWIFNGPFSVPAGATRVLEYRMELSCQTGSFEFVNKASGKIGSTIVGSSATQSQGVRIDITATSGGSCSVTSSSTVELDDLPIEVVTGAVKSLTPNQATTLGTVDANGQVVSVVCEYSTDPELAGKTVVPARIPADGQTVVSDNAQSVECDLNGLNSNTTYYYRVVGGTTPGQILSFRTPLPPATTPTITTLTPTDVLFSGGDGVANLRGQVNPGGQQVRVRFVYALVDDLSCTNARSAVYITNLQPADAESGTSASPLEMAGSFNTDFEFLQTGLSNGAFYCYQAIVDYNFNDSTSTYGTTLLGSSVSFRVTSTLPPTVNTSPATSVTGTQATLNGSVTRGGANAQAGFCITSSPQTGGVIPNCMATSISATPSNITATGTTNITLNRTGLTPGLRYYFQAVANDGTNTSYGSIEEFVTPGPPVAETVQASAVKSESAVINGLISANGASTNVFFCFTTSPAVTDSVLDHCLNSTNTFSPSITTQVTDDSGETPRSAELSGLSPSTVYYFQIIGVNSNGVSYGSVQTFTTLAPPEPPRATTSAVSNLANTSARLNGVINGGNSDVNVNFCWGTDSALAGCTLVSASPSVVSGATDTNVNLNLTGLRGSRTYYYRVSAAGVNGSATGEIVSFTTPEEPPTAVTNDPPTYSATAASLSGLVSPGSRDSSVSFCLATSDTLTGEALTCLLVVSGSDVVNAALSAYDPAVTATANVYGLTTRQYWYQVIVVNVDGTTAYGAPKYFAFGTNPPVPTTVAATEVTTLSATLNGSVEAGDEEAQITFCYSLASNLSTCIAVVGASPSAVSASGAISVSAAIAGLSAGTTYYFAVIAQDSNVAVTASALSFTTPTLPASDSPISSASTESPAASPTQSPPICSAFLDMNSWTNHPVIRWLITMTQYVGSFLNSLAKSPVGEFLAQHLSVQNPVLGQTGYQALTTQPVVNVLGNAQPKKSTDIDPNSINLESGGSTGQVNLDSNDGTELEILSLDSNELEITPQFSGSDFNNPLTWQALGYGPKCWKLEPFTDADYFYTLPNPIQLPPGTAAGNWVYSNVIVKAGSLTARSDTYQTDTVFAAPKPGDRVFADINANGIFDPGGRNGDKAISHVIICITNLDAPAPTPTPTQSPTVTTSPTTSPAVTTSPTTSPAVTTSPTASNTVSPTPTPATQSPAPTRSEIVLPEDCIWPEPTQSPPIAPPEPTRSPIIQLLVAPPTTSGGIPLDPTLPGWRPLPIPNPQQSIQVTTPAAPCLADSQFGVAMLLTNGTSHLCYKTTTLYMTYLSFPNFFIPAAPEAIPTKSPVVTKSPAATKPPAKPGLADTGFDNFWLFPLTMLLMVIGLGLIRLARRND